MKDKIYVAYCPERVLPGNVIYELEHNDRVIGGINEESTTKAQEFYGQFDGKTKDNYLEIDAISSATITTNGYLEAIGRVLDAVEILEGGAK